MLTNLIEGTILQYVCVSNHQVIQLNFTQYVNSLESWGGGGKYSKVRPSELKK